MGIEYHYSIVRKYLLGMGNGRFTLMYTVSDILAREEIEKLRNNECPFCGRRFRTKASLVSHLTLTGWRTVKIPSYGTDYPAKYEIYPTNPCPFLFKELVMYIVNTYRNIKMSMDYWGKELILKVNGNMYRFRSWREMGEFLRHHPEVVRCFEP